MSTEWKKEVAAWKKQFPLYMRLFYTIVGYPPKHQLVSDQDWKEWKSRFDTPEYDWTHHSAVPGSDKNKQ